ncbi:hypothetical protein ALP15_02635 [Pseudomonas savastanoi]|uniref:Uncharacterized protein n=1 Tax=Pseudomonas savastanoi TaxID=29438 RepID=A0A3M6A8E7_PSESS|nr:Unknown protein sequence [Pseudomonas syringae pv. cunninghamiae]RMV15579.1 hypothetical protein ALP15_02635 [Pseudomonas savastanoi]
MFWYKCASDSEPELLVVVCINYKGLLLRAATVGIACLTGFTLMGAVVSLLSAPNGMKPDRWSSLSLEFHCSPSPGLRKADVAG